EQDFFPGITPKVANATHQRIILPINRVLWKPRRTPEFFLKQKELSGRMKGQDIIQTWRVFPGAHFLAGVKVPEPGLPSVGAAARISEKATVRAECQACIVNPQGWRRFKHMSQVLFAAVPNSDAGVVRQGRNERSIRGESDLLYPSLQPIQSRDS